MFTEVCKLNVSAIGSKVSADGRHDCLHFSLSGTETK